MTFQFTETQKNELLGLISTAEAAYQANNAGQGIWTAAYQRTYEMITQTTVVTTPTGTDTYYDPAVGVDYYVWRWIGGAQFVNAGTGGFAGFIRDYTELQHQIRYGEPTEEGEIQKASDAVASNFFEDLRGNLEDTPAERRIGPDGLMRS